MTFRYLQVDEALTVVRGIAGSEHAVSDLGLLVSALDRPQINVFGTEAYRTLHLKAAALLQSVARNRALIDGNKRTAWVCCRIFLRLNGVPVTAPPPVEVAGPFVEEVAQGHMEVPTIAKRLVEWFPTVG